MTASILPSQFTIASNGQQVYMSAVFPKPNLAMFFLMMLLAWTIVALAVTGLGSIISLFFISVSLAITLVALEGEIKKLQGG